MNDDIKKMTKDVQDRIREMAYTMWESAGRQHGMATEYWLAAEREVLKTMQRAAETLMPGSGKAAKQSDAAKAPAAAKPTAKSAPEAAEPAATPAPAAAAAKPAPAPAAKPEPAPAKPAPAPAAEKPAATAAASIEDIEGIGPAFAKKLKAAGIETPSQLLDRCGAAKGRKAVVDATGIPMKRVLRWVNMADLMRVDGVDGNLAELLEAAGVDTVKELATRRADNLAATMSSVNKAKNLARTAPTEKTVAGWIDQAKSLAPKVSH